MTQYNLYKPNFGLAQLSAFKRAELAKQIAFTKHFAQCSTLSTFHNTPLRHRIYIAKKFATSTFFPALILSAILILVGQLLCYIIYGFMPLFTK